MKFADFPRTEWGAPLCPKCRGEVREIQGVGIWQCLKCGTYYEGTGENRPLPKREAS